MPGGTLKPPAPLHPLARTHSKATPAPSVTERHGVNPKAQICGALHVAPDDLAPGEKLTALLRSWHDHLGHAEVPAMLREYNAGRAQRRPQ
jgi:hypothetical protein